MKFKFVHRYVYCVCARWALGDFFFFSSGYLLHYDFRRNLLLFIIYVIYFSLFLLTIINYFLSSSSSSSNHLLQSTCSKRETTIPNFLIATFLLISPLFLSTFTGFPSKIESRFKLLSFVYTWLFLSSWL